MKPFCAMIVLALVGSVISVPAQAQVEEPGPAYIGVIEAVVDGRRIPLERQTAIMRMKTKALGMGGVETRYEIKGENSPIRLRPGQNFFFVSRFASGTSDPRSMFVLNSMNKNKKYRAIPQMSTGGYFNFSFDPLKEKASSHRIPLEFETYRKDFVKIIPAVPLPPGEYFIQFGGGFDGFAFGVD